jgi:sulfur-carrier protein
MITVQVRYFASLREALGEGESVPVVAQGTVADLRDLLIARGALHAQVLDRRRLVRCAVAQVMCSEEAVLNEGAEVAFFPPVTGG